MPTPASDLTLHPTATTNTCTSETAITVASTEEMDTTSSADASDSNTASVSANMDESVSGEIPATTQIEEQTTESTNGTFTDTTLNDLAEQQSATDLQAKTSKPRRSRKKS